MSSTRKKVELINEKRLINHVTNGTSGLNGDETNIISYGNSSAHSSSEQQHVKVTVTKSLYMSITHFQSTISFHQFVHLGDKLHCKERVKHSGPLFITRAIQTSLSVYHWPYSQQLELQKALLWLVEVN